MNEVREVRLRPRMAGHDVAFKRRTVTRLLAGGARVRLRYMLRAREALSASFIRGVLEELSAFLEALACEVVEAPRSNIRSVEATVAPTGTPPDGAGARLHDRGRPC